MSVAPRIRAAALIALLILILAWLACCRGPTYFT